MSGAETATNPNWASLQATLPAGAVIVTDSGVAPYGQVLLTHDHVGFADATEKSGGAASGPEPHELILMALGACTAITVRMYAARKGWTLDKIGVRLSYLHDAPAAVFTSALSSGQSLTASVPSFMDSV